MPSDASLSVDILPEVDRKALAKQLEVIQKALANNRC